MSLFFIPFMVKKGIILYEKITVSMNW